MMMHSFVSFCDVLLTGELSMFLLIHTLSLMKPVTIPSSLSVTVSGLPVTTHVKLMNTSFRNHACVPAGLDVCLLYAV